MLLFLISLGFFPGGPFSLEHKSYLKKPSRKDFSYYIFFLQGNFQEKEVSQILLLSSLSWLLNRV
ncbi:MAG: hypothetical protein DRJ11_08835 [Candidatus Aminicenantes bacterium]|nr:MAG: hypothetical protein DRJ11_08835 [Candidatus Aminicenantes bacterium]